jgi:excinuclease ABC subunit C
LTSELDIIPGIGVTRRKRLLKHFGSVRAIRQATVDELARAPGMTKQAAEAIARYFATAVGTMPDADYES